MTRMLIDRFYALEKIGVFMTDLDTYKQTYILKHAENEVGP